MVGLVPAAHAMNSGQSEREALQRCMCVFVSPACDIAYMKPTNFSQNNEGAMNEMTTAVVPPSRPNNASMSGKRIAVNSVRAIKMVLMSV